MSGTIEPGFERFLVEDVILTLGNLRGTLAWVLHSEAGDGTTRQRAWLERIDNPDQMISVQMRRASLLARQGKLDEARALEELNPMGGDASQLPPAPNAPQP